MVKASWILITIVAVLTLAAGVASTSVAYFGKDDEFGQGGAKLSEVAKERPELATAVRSRRATSAVYAVGWATFLLFVTLGPYRRGEKWAWWAILTATVVPAALSALRVPLLGTWLGVGPALTQAGVIVLGLLLDVRRLKA